MNDADTKEQAVTCIYTIAVLMQERIEPFKKRIIQLLEELKTEKSKPL